MSQGNTSRFSMTSSDQDLVQDPIRDLHMDNDSMYFEFKFKHFKNESSEKTQFILIIRDITSIIRSQQKMTDKLYQDAIEANYSHEQMTPLNCILNNTNIVKSRIIDFLKTAPQNLVSVYQ